MDTHFNANQHLESLGKEILRMYQWGTISMANKTIVTNNLVPADLKGLLAGNIGNKNLSYQRIDE